MQNKIKNIIIGTGIAITTVGGSAGITQCNINAFRSDLQRQGIEQTQAQHLSEYFKGNFLVGKRDTISIQEMQAISKLYEVILKEGKISEFQNKKDLIKKLNKEISKK